MRRALSTFLNTETVSQGRNRSDDHGTAWTWHHQHPSKVALARGEEWIQNL